jgi:predicted ATPase
MLSEAAFIRSLALRPAGEGDAERRGHPWGLAAVEALAQPLELHPKVTFFVGENGSGKSTVIEALAAAAGMNPEGGSSNVAFSTRPEEGSLADALRLVRGPRRPRTDFFLRAESVFNAATYLEELASIPYAGDSLKAYGGTSLHEQSHGESFLAIVLNRFGGAGLYVLDEPEAALSVQNCLTLLSRIDQLVAEGSQFVIATHSPVVLAYPDATIYRFSEDGVEPIGYDEAPPVRLMRAFLHEPAAFLRRLTAE